MSDFLDALERDLVAAARDRAARTPRPAPRSRPSLRSVALAAALLVLTAGTAAAGTLLVLRGSPIPAPAGRDVPPEQTPATGSARVPGLRAPDPDPRQPPWTVRVSRSRTGFVCSTVGQVVDGDFGLVGLDGRFRLLPERIVDGCSRERTGGAALIGARVFDAPRDARAVRTVVNGVGGDGLRRVVVEAGGGRRDVAAGPGGVFATALRGYPEDLAVGVTLTFAGGRTERHAFGRADFVVPDPAGGRAWKTSAVGGRGSSCVQFGAARPGPRSPYSPLVCGDGPLFFAVRRFVPGPDPARGQEPVRGRWGGHPPRTAVCGRAGGGVRGISVLGAGPPRGATIMRGNRAFLVVLGPGARPEQLTVRTTYADGRVVDRRGDLGLGPLPRELRP